MKLGREANFQRDDLIQENWEAEGIGFHLRRKKKKSLEYGFKESWSYLATEKRNRCQSR